MAGDVYPKLIIRFPVSLCVGVLRSGRAARAPEDDRAGHPYPRQSGARVAQNEKLELTWKTAETMAKAMKATNENAMTSTEAEIVCETAPSQRSRSAR